MVIEPQFDDWENDRPAPAGEAFRVDLDGFEGPIDMLLSLARDQKVDLTQISILALAEQYLAYIERAKRLQLDIAADYLVMAAWLAYLKSRMLLPEQPHDEDEPTGEELAALLAQRLQRLEAFKAVAEQLVALPQLDSSRLPRGMPEPIDLTLRPVYDLSLYEMLKAYADRRVEADTSTLEIRATRLCSVEDAIARLSRILGAMPDWTTLESLLSEALRGGLRGRSELASTFVATLELARQGRLILRQDETFGTIFLRGVAADLGAA